MLELIGVAVSAVAAIVTAGWALLQLAGRQYEKRLDDRFAVQDKAREEGRRESDEKYKKFEELQRQLERDFLGFKATLPVEYVRREDHIRFETVINAKIDSVYTKLELIAERQMNQRTAS